MRNILITGIGGPTPRSIAKTLRKIDPQYKITGIDSNPKAIGFHLPDLIDHQYVVPGAKDATYWDRIMEIIKTRQIDLAFIQPEVEVIAWGKYFEKHNRYPVKTLIPPTALSASLMDKAIMAELLEDTPFIPRTIKISQDDPRLEEIGDKIGYPCWIRATKGSGGYGSLKIENESNLQSWLFIHKTIAEFTVSEFLPGRHLANQMLYYEGEYIKGASLECVEYVMASVAPSRVTGNTSYGRFINEDAILDFSHSCITHIADKLHIKPHGVLSFDLKEDRNGALKVTEVNIRHMAYTGIMAEVGFDLVYDTLQILESGITSVKNEPHYQFKEDYAFLRDVDVEPIIVNDHRLQK